MKFEIDQEIFDDSLRIVEEIFPLHRSISGNGINTALDILKNEIGGKIYQYNTDLRHNYGGNN